jgi:hypothetical protein
VEQNVSLVLAAGTVRAGPAAHLKSCSALFAAVDMVTGCQGQRVVMLVMRAVVVYVCMRSCCTSHGPQMGVHGPMHLACAGGFIRVQEMYGPQHVSRPSGCLFIFSGLL